MDERRRRDRRHPRRYRRAAFRGRLLDGLAQSIAERGYRATTVADVVRHAKTSKRTFYDEFASKEECFVELLRTNNDDLIAASRLRSIPMRSPAIARSEPPSAPTSTTSNPGRPSR